METKQTLVTLPSGSIDLVHTKDKDVDMIFLQFNSSCQDALPYCHAMCCRMHQYYTADLTEEEAKRLGCRVLNTQEGDKLVLPTKFSPVNNECLFILDNNTCKVHSEKPKNCARWHCSPGGVGEGLEVKSKGWMLLPTQR